MHYEVLTECFEYINSSVKRDGKKVRIVGMGIFHRRESARRPFNPILHFADSDIRTAARWRQWTRQQKRKGDLPHEERFGKPMRRKK